MRCVHEVTINDSNGNADNDSNNNDTDINNSNGNVDNDSNNNNDNSSNHDIHFLDFYPARGVTRYIYIYIYMYIYSGACAFY